MYPKWSDPPSVYFWANCKIPCFAYPRYILTAIPSQQVDIIVLILVYRELDWNRWFSIDVVLLSLRFQCGTLCRSWLIWCWCYIAWQASGVARVEEGWWSLWGRSALQVARSRTVRPCKACGTCNFQDWRAEAVAALSAPNDSGTPNHEELFFRV